MCMYVPVSNERPFSNFETRMNFFIQSRASRRGREFLSFYLMLLLKESRFDNTIDARIFKNVIRERFIKKEKKTNKN